MFRSFLHNLYCILLAQADRSPKVGYGVQGVVLKGRIVHCITRAKFNYHITGLRIPLQTHDIVKYYRVVSQITMSILT